MLTLTMAFRLLVLVLLALPLAQARVEENVVYAMRGGLGMLMDVHYPDQSNGFGIILGIIYVLTQIPVD